MKGDSLGDRMKGYEDVSRHKLIRRMPVIVRLDGKAFHTFTKNQIIKNDTPPFSNIMHNLMVNTTLALFDSMQNSVLAYTQSDEISILLRDWDKITTEQWFDANLQKIVSVSASIATAKFNMLWNVQKAANPSQPSKGGSPTFDSRAWNLPKEEVVNYFLWRQQDASRNSVQMLGHHHFSQKEMHGKNNSQIQDMLVQVVGVNWNDLETWKKRGTVVLRQRDADGKSLVVVDENPPIFSQDRNYIGKFLEVENEVED